LLVESLLIFYTHKNGPKSRTLWISSEGNRLEPGGSRSTFRLTASRGSVRELLRKYENLGVGPGPLHGNKNQPVREDDGLCSLSLRDCALPSFMEWGGGVFHSPSRLTCRICVFLCGYTYEQVELRLPPVREPERMKYTQPDKNHPTKNSFLDRAAWALSD
jgi:hypothetical protein